jgi:alpha-aminoadipic semialdehyde synthase
MLRGTLRFGLFLFIWECKADMLANFIRYPGFCELMHCFKTLGLLEDTGHIVLEDWHAFLRISLEKRHNIKLPDDSSSIISILKSFVSLPHYDRVVGTLIWLSLIPGNPISLPLPPKQPAAPIDLFTMVLAHKLKYERNERDLVILSHEVVAKSIDKPGVDEIYTSSLVAYGTPEVSAMSRCVGLPTAFASLQVLDGNVSVRGVQCPTDAAVYSPILERLQEVGLGMKEAFERGKSMEYNLEKGLLGHQSPSAPHELSV